MKTFLQHVAASLLQKFGTDLSHVTVVFPGKRASLFLDQALASCSTTPVWTPRYRTISELFQQASSYTLCDAVEAVCRLHLSYKRYVEDPQPLDKFYSWGEVLLADFDDVDKHLVDAKRLFANIHDIKALDDNSYITKEQEHALSSFFSNFSLEGNTELKQRFLRLWNQMGNIYNDYLQRLRADGLLYEGALQRDVVDRLTQACKKGTEPVGLRPYAFEAETTFAFVGFNVLNGVEQALFDELQKRHQALFYWDYDKAYIRQNHEAGLFIRRNLSRYGNELSEDCFDNFGHEKQLTFVTASSENAQARDIPHWLSENLTPQENQTAIVLCNEQLLQPVLHSIPSNTNPEKKQPSVSCSTVSPSSCQRTPHAVNITMGFSLTDTPLYSFLNALLLLQTDGYDSAHHRFRPALLKAVERHPFAPLVGEEAWKRQAGNGANLIAYLLDILARLAPHFADNSIYQQLYAEATFQAFTAITRLLDLMGGDHPLLIVSDQTLRRLLRSVLQSITIPFHGEPAIGLQVMGLLETRALDFEHLLLLSVGEGFLPKAVSETSFIPYHLREAFGLTTLPDKIAVYAYYFYRLIQRAQHVTFIYNESNAGTRQNEMSRFLRQLQAETSFPINHLQLQAASQAPLHLPIIKEKTPEVMQRLRSLFDNTGLTEHRRLLSPSALNTYTACPLRFYYRYVQGLRIDPDPQDGLDAILFGNIFHRAAELVYRQLTSAGNIIHAHDIEPLLDSGAQRLQPFVRKAFREQFFRERPEIYNGILIIALRVIQTYLLQLLRYDHRHAPIHILGLEVPRTTTLHIDGLELDTGGIIDRLDRVADPALPGGNVIRVIDYKTGGFPASVATLEKLFTQSSQKEEYFFQTILYASIVAHQEQQPVTPCLFFVHHARSADYSPQLRLARQTITDVRTIADEFQSHLHSLISTIFDPKTPFTQTERTDNCTHCHYSHLCGI
ncbi:MAG: PD-(D/E)XK nuclease family protein [Bacteroidaceae bacterium]|nr:PD-(D/E)XK nuclease family protein [Bacteroidaceae bacterium]